MTVQYRMSKALDALVAAIEARDEATVEVMRERVAEIRAQMTDEEWTIYAEAQMECWNIVGEMLRDFGV